MFHVKHRRGGLLAAVLLLAIVSAGCAQIAQPSGWAAPVALSDGLVLVQLTAGQYTALDPATGTERWRYPEKARKNGQGAFYATPVVDGGTIYTVALDGIVSRVEEPGSGGSPAETWTTELDEQVVATPVLRDDRLYVATEEGQVHVLDAASGLVVASLKASEGRIWGSPAVTSSQIYVGDLDRQATVALDRTGTQAWRQELAGASASDLVLEGDLLLVGSFDRALHALDVTQDGSERWRFEGDGWFMGPPYVAGDTIYAATMRGTVYAIDMQGAQRWSYTVPDAEFRSSPVLAGGALVIADRDGSVFGLNPSNGELMWRQDVADARIEAHPLLLESGVFYITTKHDLLRVDPAGGSVTRVTGSTTPAAAQ